ncbi:MAG: glycosyltransferase family 4 protein [Candidatus Nanopelagicales bacterium]|nr:glycosyltransferase family 4 protein [Candidatus Nanopelagicales bacterium]
MSGRTLVITNDFPPRAGGIQAFVHNLVIRQPHGSVVVFAADWRGAAEFDSKLPFPVYRHSRTVMLPTPATLRRALDIATAEGCDRVLFGATAPLGLLGTALRKHGMQRLVGITHGHEAAWGITPGTRGLLRRIGDSLDTITYLGEYTRSRIAGALSPGAADRMRRLVPGVDAGEFTPDRCDAGLELRERLGLADRQVIVCVSRLMPRKGQDSLIAALPRIRRRVPEAALLLVGGGPYRGKLERQVRLSGQERHVVITGSVPWETMPNHYAAGDVFAMPCRTRRFGQDVEGLGIVYLEASATGLPVIAGDSGGAPDAVLDEVTGLVVSGRSEAQIADALVRLLSDPGLRARMAETGRDWVTTEWRWDRSARRLADLLAGPVPSA